MNRSNSSTSDDSTAVFHDCVENLVGATEENNTTTPRSSGGLANHEVFSTPMVNSPDVRLVRPSSVRRQSHSSRKNQNHPTSTTPRNDIVNDRDEEMGPLLLPNDSSNNNTSDGSNPIIEEGEQEEETTHHRRRSGDNNSNNNINAHDNNDENESGSSTSAAVFNFTNSIIGAGCIGLGGAIAQSGGFISIALITFFAILTKASLDLVIRLSLELAEQQEQEQQQQQQQTQQVDVSNNHLSTLEPSSTTPTTALNVPPTSSVISYEELAQAGMGTIGRLVVLACKFSYSFGCLVAYVIVIKDNFGPALKSLIFGDEDADHSDDNNGNSTMVDLMMETMTTTTTTTMETEDSSMTFLKFETPATEHIHRWLYFLLSENALFTWTISSVLILPLCMLRDMTPLASASLVSIVSMFMIVAIVIYIYFACPDIRRHQSDETFFEKWIEVRPGVLDNLGTFIFTFVSQHTVHLVFTSLKPKLQTLSKWKIVSSWSITSAAIVSLLVGVFVYMTFGQDTKSDIFLIYPHSWMIDTAKLLLCVTMTFTFPLPFFTCRELIIVTLIHPFCGIESDDSGSTGDDAAGSTDNSLEEPLLLGPNNNDPVMMAESTSSDSMSVASELSRRVLESATPKNWLLPDDNRQLLLPGHIGVTFKLWLVVTCLAIAAPSLGDILDLVGCASGTLIAFIIPALLSFRLEGYTNLALLILLVGGAVGTVGTYYSVFQLIKDIGL
mmetsp:Transcript_4820/g.12269  ORF Transcript_4820/g.12269 Transcript_4820/m.12269 type:complete len:725 (-) Transcript_4820:113-2287(-)